MTPELTWNTSTPAHRASLLRSAIDYAPKNGSEFYHVRFHRLSPRLQSAVSDWLNTGAQKRMRLSGKDLVQV